MRRNRTPLLLAPFLCLAIAGCGEELTNCDPVEGIYRPVFELVAGPIEHFGEPGWCSVIDLDRLDLSRDDHTVNTGTSALHTVVERFGCEVKVTYTVTITSVGSPQNGYTDRLSNNVARRYSVGDRGVLSGETIYARSEMVDVDGQRVLVERCRALFQTTWLPEAIYNEMHPDSGIAP